MNEVHNKQSSRIGRIVSQLVACITNIMDSVLSEKPLRVTKDSCVMLISKDPGEFATITGTAGHSSLQNMHFHFCNSILLSSDSPLLDKVSPSGIKETEMARALNRKYFPREIIKRSGKKDCYSIDFGHIIIANNVSDSTSKYKNIEEMFSCWPPPLFMLGVSLLQLAVFIFYGSSLDECSLLVSSLSF